MSNKKTKKTKNNAKSNGIGFFKEQPVMSKAERKKKIVYGIAAVICIFLALYMEKLEKQEEAAETSVTTEITGQEEYNFRNEDLLEDHYKKHGMEMGFESMEAYEDAACAVVNNPQALTKTEKEDGDYVYYIEESNEFVVVSQDGYIRTYFNPDDGVEYFNRQ